MSFDGNDNNPYAPPTDLGQHYSSSTQNDDELQFPAERGTRFLARLVDNLLSLLIVIPVMLVLLAVDVLDLKDLKNTLVAGLLSLTSLPIAIYQWVLISKTGQSIGKKFMRIRIVKLDGSRVDFASGVVLREWIIQAIAFVPFVGSCVSLIDALMIFGEERRCLHDQIAGTKVIQVLSN